MRLRPLLMCIAPLMAAPLASAESSGDLSITLTVPEVCQMDSSAIEVDASGLSASGVVLEMCNSGRAFRVVATHRQLESGEQARILYGSEMRDLDVSGVSDIAYRTGPVYGNVPVEIETSGLVGGLSVSLGIAVL